MDIIFQIYPTGNISSAYFLMYGMQVSCLTTIPTPPPSLETRECQMKALMNTIHTGNLGPSHKLNFCSFYHYNRGFILLT